jgi:hypothetical protein
VPKRCTDKARPVAGSCSVVVRPAQLPAARPLVLAEVVLYRTDGSQIPSSQLDATLSSTCCDIYPGWPGPFPASACIDGDTTNLCHSLLPSDDPAPTLRITYPCLMGRTTVARVVVHNRNGATWGSDSAGNLDFYVLDFENDGGASDRRRYTFLDARKTTVFTILPKGRSCVCRPMPLGLKLWGRVAVAHAVLAHQLTTPH